MSFTRMMEGNEAAAWGAKLSRADVVPAYPITPQTELISHIATLIANGEMDAQYIKVEGEHTAMAAACGASAAGARVFTASSSQGIAFMEEEFTLFEMNRFHGCYQRLGFSRRQIG